MYNLIQVSISQFYGIEINHFVVTVTKTASWIAESQMMKETENIVQKPLDFLPLINYILVPRHSSENRRYIPLEFMSADIIYGNASNMISETNLYHFGFLTFNMHMTWLRAVCCRLKSNYHYSKDIVYNNFH